MPYTTQESIDDAVLRFVAKSRDILQERSGVMWDSLEHEDLPNGQGPTVTVPKYNQLNVGQLTDGIDMANAQEILDTPTTITPAEWGGQVVLTDMMMMTVRDSFFDVGTRLLRNAYDRQVDIELCDDIDNLSQTLGSAGTAFNIGHLMAGHASVKYNAPANGTAGRGGEPAPDPTFCVATPSQLHSLRKTLAGGIGASANTQITPETERMKKVEGAFTIDGIPGLTVKSDINIEKDSSDDAKLGIFSKMWQIISQLGSVSVTRERDESLRAWEVNIVGRWGRAEYNDSYGREGTFDSALPTS
jgi:hypothetical protein